MSAQKRVRVHSPTIPPTWLLISPEATVVSAVLHHILRKLKMPTNTKADLLLQDTLLPPHEDASVIRDGDMLHVRPHSPPHFAPTFTFRRITPPSLQPHSSCVTHSTPTTIQKVVHLPGPNLQNGIHATPNGGTVDNTENTSRARVLSASLSAEETPSFRECNLEPQLPRKARETDTHNLSDHSSAISAEKSRHLRTCGGTDANKQVQIQGNLLVQAVEGVRAKKQTHAQATTSVQAFEGVNTKKQTQANVETPVHAVKELNTKRQTQSHVDTPVLVVNGARDKVSAALDPVNVRDDCREPLDGKEAHTSTLNVHEDSRRPPAKHQTCVSSIRNMKTVESVGRENVFEKVAALPAYNTSDLGNDANAMDATQFMDEGFQLASDDPINQLRGSKATDNDENISRREQDVVADELRNSQHIPQPAQRYNNEAITTFQHPFDGSTSSKPVRVLKVAPIAKPAVISSSTTSVLTCQKHLCINSPSTRNPSVAVPACSGHPAVIRPWTESLLCSITPLALISKGKGQEKNGPQVLDGNVARKLSTSELHSNNAAQDSMVYSKHAQTESITPAAEIRTASKKRPYSLMSSPIIGNDVLVGSKRERGDARIGISKENGVDNKKKRNPPKPKRTLTKEAKRKRNMRNRMREKKKRLKARKFSALTELGDLQVSQNVGKNNPKNNLQVESSLPSVLRGKRKSSTLSSPASCEEDKKGFEGEIPKNSSTEALQTTAVNLITTSFAKGSTPCIALKETRSTGPTASHASGANAKLDPSDRRNSHSLPSADPLTEKHHVQPGPRKKKFKAKPRPYAMALGSVAAALTRARSEGVLHGDAENAGGKVQSVLGNMTENVSPTGAEYLAATMKLSTKPPPCRRKSSKKAKFYFQEEQYNESLFVGWESATEQPLPPNGLLDIFCPNPGTDPMQGGKSALNSEDVSHNSDGHGKRTKPTLLPALEELSSVPMACNNRGSHNNKMRKIEEGDDASVYRGLESEVQKGRGASRTQANGDVDECNLHGEGSLSTEPGRNIAKKTDLANSKSKDGCSPVKNDPLSVPILKQRSREQTSKPNISEDIQETSTVDQKSSTQFPLVGPTTKEVSAEGEIAQTEVLSSKKKLTPGMGAVDMSTVEPFEKRMMTDLPSGPAQTSRQKVSRVDSASLEHDSWKSDVSQLLHHEPCNNQGHLPLLSFSIQPQDVAFDPLLENVKKQMKHSAEPEIHENKGGLNATSKRKEKEISTQERSGNNAISLRHLAEEANGVGQSDRGTLSSLLRPSTTQSAPRIGKTAKESSDYRDTLLENATNSSFSKPCESAHSASQEPCDPECIKRGALKQTEEPSIDSLPRSLGHKPKKDLSPNTPHNPASEAFNLFGVYSEASSENISARLTPLYEYDKQTNFRQQHAGSTLTSTSQVEREAVAHQGTNVNEHALSKPFICGRNDKSLSVFKGKGDHPRQPADFRSMMVQALSEASAALVQLHAQR